MIIKVNTTMALNLLKRNREKHIEEYEIQMQGWKKAMDQFGKDLAVWKDSLSEGPYTPEKRDKRPLEPQRPNNYVRDYDEYIELLEHHQEDLVGLDEHEFEKIIKNQFAWRQGFLAMTNTYSAK